MSVGVGDCRELLAQLAPDSIDATVTDPPYHLTAGKKGGSGPASMNENSPAGRARIGTGFMGKAWDGGDVAFRPETWVAVLRVMKPGAYLLAFGGTRTFHRLACAIEDAGFELRDCISWLYGSGFPKHESTLKPAWEPVLVGRKPAPKATALNIDACRLAFLDAADEAESKEKNRHADFGSDTGASTVYGDFSMVPEKNYDAPGRWPANVVVDEEAAAAIDAQSGELGAGNHPAVRNTSSMFTRNAQGATEGMQRTNGGGASRFYYTAKASRSEREFGLEGFERGAKRWSSGEQSPGTFQSAGTDKTSTNHHPTVKPVELMRWLCRLVTPPRGRVLDPFTGSGTTGVAAVAEGFAFTGCELVPEYAAIARARIDAAQPSLFGPVAP